MIVLLLLVSFTLLLVHLRLAPRRYLVHAARARDFPEERKPSRKIPSPFAYLLADGSFYSRKGRFYGEALGDSMAAHGINNGDEFFGDFISAKTGEMERLKRVAPGSIVVVEDVAKASKTGKRLRKVMSISDEGMLTFFEDHEGEGHTERSVDKVIAVVTHVAT